MGEKWHPFLICPQFFLGALHSFMALQKKTSLATMWHYVMPRFCSLQIRNLTFHAKWPGPGSKCHLIVHCALTLIRANFKESTFRKNKTTPVLLVPAQKMLIVIDFPGHIRDPLLVLGSSIFSAKWNIGRVVAVSSATRRLPTSIAKTNG